MENAVGQTSGLLVALATVVDIGAVIGWLAGMNVKGRGFGLLGDVVIGIAGSFLAGFMLPRLGLPVSDGVLVGMLASVVGAVALLLILRMIRRVI